MALRADPKFIAAVSGYRHNFETDEFSSSVLDRLIESLEASNAFKKVPREQWEMVLCDCTLAERLARNLDAARHDRVEGEAADAASAADRAVKALATVRAFVATSASDNGAYNSDIWSAISLLAQEIASVRRFNEISAATLPRKRDMASARARGIGWIKEAIKKATGADNFEIVATLAEAALDMGDITIDAVKNAPTPKDIARRI